MSVKAIVSALMALRLPLGTALTSRAVDPAVAKTLALPESLKISITSFGILAMLEPPVFSFCCKVGGFIRRFLSAFQIVLGFYLRSQDFQELRQPFGVGRPGRGSNQIAIGVSFIYRYVHPFASCIFHLRPYRRIGCAGFTLDDSRCSQYLRA